MSIQAQYLGWAGFTWKDLEVWKRGREVACGKVARCIMQGAWSAAEASGVALTAWELTRSLPPF